MKGGEKNHFSEIEERVEEWKETFFGEREME